MSSIIKVDANNEANFTMKKLIDKGKYVFEIATAKLDKAKSSGNPLLKVELRCCDEGIAKGAAVYDTIALVKKAEWKFAHLCLSAGFTKEDIVNGVDVNDLVGRFITAEITIQPAGEYKGTAYKERNIVDSYVFEA